MVNDGHHGHNVQGNSLTFGEVDELTDTLAGWLYSKGVRVGSTVGIFMEHRTEYALAYIAAHKVRRLEDMVH